MSKLLVQATAPFAGDPFQNQLALAPGDLVELANEGCLNLNNGWGYGKHVQSGREGWFPTSYVRPYQQPVRATPVNEADYNPFAAAPTLAATPTAVTPGYVWDVMPQIKGKDVESLGGNLVPINFLPVSDFLFPRQLIADVQSFARVPFLLRARHAGSHEEP